eukprot:752292-Hanusia_phi.AAC.1
MVYQSLIRFLSFATLHQCSEQAPFQHGAYGANLVSFACCSPCENPRGPAGIARSLLLAAGRAPAHSFESGNIEALLPLFRSPPPSPSSDFLS